MQFQKSWPWLLFLVVAALLTGCSSSRESAIPEKTDKPSVKETASMSPTDLPPAETEPSFAPDETQTGAAQRNSTSNIQESELSELNLGNQAFAFDLYQAIRSENTNLFISPYSISLALAMIYGGARNTTAQQMAETLHFTLPGEQVHTGFNALDLQLASRAAETEVSSGFKLNIANSTWIQSGRPLMQGYLDLLAEKYAADLNLTDYARDPEGSRDAINQWVSQETDGKIEDLIPSGAIDTLTRLVLANAIYFNAAWQNTFNQNLTKEAPFYLLDGSQISVPMMAQSGPKSYRYTAGKEFQAVELPYSGGQLAMVIIIPNEGVFEAFEAGLTAENLAEILGNLKSQQLELKMPKFGFESEFELSYALQHMGMPAAFDPQAADFSGIDGTRELFIADVVHKALVDVDEEGTEAAAATAVIVGVTSMPVTELQLTIDHPFIFLIQDKPTGTILFLGRVLNPGL